MAKRRAKKNLKKSDEDLVSDSICTNADEQDYEIQRQKNYQEFEHRTAVIKAIIDAEREHFLIWLRLVRSIFKEELQIPLLQFLEENTPNLRVKLDEEGGQFEIELKDKVGNVSVSHVEETSMHESLLQQISQACPDFVAAGLPSVGGIGFSRKAGNVADVLGAADFQISDFVMEESLESQNFGLLPNGFQTPGGDSQRLSFGMTPKTLRLPKPGEMLLSVRGSPLGVYKDDNMEAIHESEES